MLASIGTGQIIARTGKYAVFPITGTATTSLGFLILTFVTIDKPLWYLMIAMFVGRPRPGPVDADAHHGRAGVRCRPRHRRGHQFGDLLPPDRRHARHRGHAVAAVQRAADEHHASLADEQTLTDAAGRGARSGGRGRTRPTQAIMAKMWTPITDKIKTAGRRQALRGHRHRSTTRSRTPSARRCPTPPTSRPRRAPASWPTGSPRLSAGLDKLSTGTGAFVNGVGQIGSGSPATGRRHRQDRNRHEPAGGRAAQVSTAESRPQRHSAKQATSDFGAVRTR